MSEQTQDQTTVLQNIVISDSVAVVTGGASGIGKGIVGALLRHGAKVVIADIEQSAIDETVAEMSAHGDVTGIRTVSPGNSTCSVKQKHSTFAK